ncbi:MAG TPA: type II restriction endonuclease [Candidatus Eisenbacteria bacterium]|jgi:hypothetical protein
MDLRQAFRDAVRGNNVDFMVRGMLSADDRVFPLGTDTKVLSTVFELFTRPLMEEIAHTHGYHVEEAKQTIYPDFTLLRDAADRAKIAVDVKTTYRRPDIVFTLGSYTSFLRNNTKNILYPYDQYGSHWIIGFVYGRTREAPTDIYPLNERAQIVAPYEELTWFVQEKYKIAGESPGSGNTANIGSVRTRRIEDFHEGRGPFARHGEAVFRDYWANYGRTPATRPYRSVAEYLAWKRRATQR